MSDETEQDKRPKPLLQLARDKFKDSGGLTDAETLMFEKTELGEQALIPGDGSSRAKAADWDDAPVIHASRIEWLCTDNEARKCVTHKGIWVARVRIEGKLDLECVRLPFQLSFMDCAFEGDIALVDAEVRGLYLDGSHAKSITADRVKVDGNVHLRNGFSAQGEVRLLGATIGGDLSCTDGKFSNEGRMCFIADGVKVAGNVFLCEGFSAQGEVRLLGATIGINLECDNGKFSNKGGKCLFADGVKVAGSAFLRNGFSAQGEVRLLGASIGGNLECDNGKFSNKGGDCLSAHGAKVDGRVFLRNGFSADGAVDFTGAEVKRIFHWHGIETPEKAKLGLRSAKVGTLYDEEKSWPKQGQLYLQGLVYDEIVYLAPTDAKSRIKWLRLQPSENFSPQPYEQLAKVLKDQGHEEEAKDILVAKNKDPGFLERMNPRHRPLHWVYGALSGYGYLPFRAGKLAVAFIVVGCVVFWIGGSTGLITPSKVKAYGNDVSGVDKAYPGFNSVVYSLDAFVPIVNLHQEEFWLPNPNKGCLFWSICGVEFRVGELFLFYLWFHIIAGWVLTTLFVTGLTKLMRS